MKKDNLVGITETGEIAFDLDAFNNLHQANVIITKRLTRALSQQLTEHRENCILHLTCTGWGGTPMEPFVPSTTATRKALDELLKSGFPVGQVVLRIDPIIITSEGIKHLNEVLEAFRDSGITRYRVSFADMYRHAKRRFHEKGLEIPHETFHAPLEDRMYVLNQITALGVRYGYEVEVCGEPGIPSTPCVSQKDIDILGLTGEITLKGSARQRDTCGCPANKKQILTKKPGRCANQCAYCYWRDDADQQ